jgi:hypothetical protein
MRIAHVNSMKAGLQADETLCATRCQGLPGFARPLPSCLLFPLAALVFRSDFMPHFLSAWIVLNGLAYWALSFTGLLQPQNNDAVAGIAFPCQLGEVAFMLWILATGAGPRAQRQVVAA